STGDKNRPRSVGGGWAAEQQTQKPIMLGIVRSTATPPGKRAQLARSFDALSRRDLADSRGGQRAPSPAACLRRLTLLRDRAACPQLLHSSFVQEEHAWPKRQQHDG